MKYIRPALSIFGLLLLVTGILYPLAVTGLAQSLFSFQSNGSLIESRQGQVGSLHIGQHFSDPCYFWGRPSASSAAPYTALDTSSLTGSSGSNLGPLSQILVETVSQRVEALRSTAPDNTLPIPVDLVTASASGLDPHISLRAAAYQVPRIARCRFMPESGVYALLAQHSEGRQLGFLGEPRVNILLLNLALDGIQ